ncbi:transcription initiation factor tfiid subunit 1 [Colletotrichum tofieldiae]|nr:transcription initiation factor tfiid subunit 1 [Colletotrichum tofieldiae]GKT74523.1 transcription initiation factor tfiid subunit 1 [Colletotrichum tofieldiae]GKT91704.1 transcription initiation factor TFIID subunit 1 [Colletotrichum tofieldiae]
MKTDNGIAEHGGFGTYNAPATGAGSPGQSYGGPDAAASDTRNMVETAEEPDSRQLFPAATNE